MSNGQIAAIIVGICVFLFLLGVYVGVTAPALGH